MTIEYSEILTVNYREDAHLLTSTDFDSRAILSVVLAGDNRLFAKLRSPDLQPIASRIRHRLLIECAEPDELRRRRPR